MSVKNVRFVWDEEFHRLVKAHAAYRGMGMAAFVEACVRAELKEQGVVRPADEVPPKNWDVRPSVPEKKPTPFIDEAPTPKPRSFADWKPAPGLSKAEQAGRKK